VTFQDFPLQPRPTGFLWCAQDARNGIYYVGQDVVVTLLEPGGGAPISLPDTYEVRDYHGTVVASGAVSASTLNLGSSWDPGWYRLYLLGASNDAKFGHSLGATNFCVIRANPNFPTLPASTGTPFWGGYVPSGSGDTDAEAIAGNGSQLGSPVEMITRACLGVGVGRLSITKTNDPDEPLPTGWDTISFHEKMMINTANPWWLQHWLDPVRPRYQWVAFPNQSTDWMRIPSALVPEWGSWLLCLPKDETINGAQVFVKCQTGTSSGYKVTVYSPNSSTLVETFDNLSATDADAAAVINASSNYIRAYPGQHGTPVVPTGPTAIGTAYRQGVIESVQRLYPLGVTRFEGPINEPIGDEELWTHAMRLFQDAVHTGHPDAKAIGPCTVNISRELNERFFELGMGEYCDEISFHDYNAIANGDINLGRNQIEDFLALLAENGQEGKVLWQTEANHVNVQNVFSVYHPRRARVVMARTLLWEQYGVPFERNPYWYDWSIGFWSYPAFMFLNYSADKSANPQAVTLCVLAQETFGKNYHHRIDFGSPSANAIFLGNVYGDARAGSVAAILTGSYLPGATVTLTVHGPTIASLVVVDGLGNESSVAVTAGHVTVPVEDIPTYVRLPAGINVSVYSVNDWGPTPNPNLAVVKRSASLGGAGHPELADGRYLRNYLGGTTSPGIVHSTSGLPDSAEIHFYDSVSVERVIIWSGPCWQAMPAIFDYDIDTWDGATWTTRKTVTKTTPGSFQHGADFTNTGTERETFWDEQWIEDVKLTSPVSCLGVRVYVRGATYGGEPDALMINDGTYDLSGNGMAVPKLAIQEIAVISGTTLTPPAVYEDEILGDSPVGYWRLGEPTGTTAASEVNSPAVDGTYVGTYTLGAAGILADNTAMSSTSPGGHVSVPYDAAHDVGDSFTLECWYKPTFFQGAISTTLINKGTGLWNMQVYAAVNGEGYLRLYREDGGGTTVASSSTPVSNSEWTHCVITKNGATTKVYLNGEDVTSPGTNYTFGDQSVGLQIGDFWAVLDEVAVYDAALDAATVLSHYRAGTAARAPLNTAAPVLEHGLPRVGTQLSCGTGSWAGGATAYAYQWQRLDDDVWGDLGGETRSTYVISGGDASKYLRCGVVASNSGGDSAVAYSNSVQAEAMLIPVRKT